jgi:hypothetical protein
VTNFTHSNVEQYATRSSAASEWSKNGGEKAISHVSQTGPLGTGGELCWRGTKICYILADFTN